MKALYWSSNAIQYTLHQDVQMVTTPDRRRAMMTPPKLPAVAMLRDRARRWEGAISATNGSITCGITVPTAQMKDMAQNAVKEVVTHRPILVDVRRDQDLCPPTSWSER